MIPPYDMTAIAAVVSSPIVGSFLATVVARLPEDESVAVGRSRCRACGRALAVRDLVPIFSWAFLRGRCRQCGAPIGLRYPLIEVAAVAAAVWAAAVVPGALIWPSCLLGWALIVLAAIDLEHFILPDVVTLPLLLAGLIVAWALDPAALWGHLAAALAMYLIFLSVGYIYRRLRDRDGLGQGDAKLAAVAGAWTSWTGAPGVVLLACAAAFVFVLWRALRGRPVRLLERIAFGPYICLGIWLIWLYGPLEIGGQ